MLHSAIVNDQISLESRGIGVRRIKFIPWTLFNRLIEYEMDIAFRTTEITDSHFQTGYSTQREDVGDTLEHDVGTHLDDEKQI
jgi:hypothetical protein